jgi:hypothetical protein
MHHILGEHLEAYVVIGWYHGDTIIVGNLPNEQAVMATNVILHNIVATGGVKRTEYVETTER